MKLEYIRIRDVKNIERGTRYSSGIDFFVPKFNEQFKYDFKHHKNCKIQNKNIIIDDDNIQLKSGESCMIPTGIKLNIATGFDLVFENKSGIASKRKLNVMTKVVDSDYQGEVFINIMNVGKEIQYIKPDTKIIQGIIRMVELCDLDEKPNESELYSTVTERGEGCLGHTDSVEEKNN